MIWLDATDPYPIPAGKFGAPRGSCNQTSGNYTKVEKIHGDSYGLFSDIRYGEIGSTLNGNPNPPPPGPHACPGGSLSKCITECPTTDPAKYKACLSDCIAHCSKSDKLSQQTVFKGESYGAIKPRTKH